MAIPEIQDFCLVGRAALSLLYGHRTSVDLDLFTHEKFENQKLITNLKRVFGQDFVMESKPVFFGVLLIQ